MSMCWIFYCFKRLCTVELWSGSNFFGIFTSGVLSDANYAEFTIKLIELICKCYIAPQCYVSTDKRWVW